MSVEISNVNRWTRAAMTVEAMQRTPGFQGRLAEATKTPVESIKTQPLLEQYGGMSVILNTTPVELRSLTASALSQSQSAKAAQIPPGEYKAAMQRASLGRLAQTPAMQAGNRLDIDLVDVTKAGGGQNIAIFAAPMSNDQIRRRVMAAQGIFPQG